MSKIKLKLSGGDNFTTVAEKAKEVANKYGLVEFEFNGVVCQVNKNTDLKLLWRDYSNAFIMGWEKIGPDCAEPYSSEVQKEFEEKKAISEQKEKERQAEYDKKCTEERNVFEEKTKNIQIELSDVGGWNLFKEKNTDPYGACCVEYAEGWAKLMQAEFAKGKKIADCAPSTSHELGFLGITGFMYGAAVSMLAKCWRHGEELRLWHNLDSQIGIEGERANEDGGVLNPALITIGFGNKLND